MLRGAVGEVSSGGESIVRHAIDSIAWTATAGVVALATLTEAMPVWLGVLLLTGSVAVASGLAAWRRVREQPQLDARVVAFGLTGDGSWDYDLRTSGIVYDDRCAEMLGYEPGAVESHLGAWGKLVHPEDLGRARRALDAFISGERDRYEVEVRLEAADGSWRRVLDRARVVERDDASRPTRLVGIHRLLPDAPKPEPVDTEIEDLGTRPTRQRAMRPRLVTSEPPKPAGTSVMEVIESAIASRGESIRVELRKGDHLGHAGIDPETLEQGMASLLDAVAELVPMGTVVPARPKAPRDLKMVGFSLGLPSGVSVDAASPHLQAARSALSGSNGRVRVRADQIIVELPAPRRGRAC